jgi:hypothetical protein
MLASRATAALAALAGVAAPLLAVGVAAQVLAFRESLAVAMQVQPVVGAREVLLLWGVRWAPGQLRAAVDERAGIERAGGAAQAAIVMCSHKCAFSSLVRPRCLTTSIMMRC